MDKLVKLVEEWSKNKGLNKSDSFRQLALARADKELLEDGIGDTIVTLIILAQQQGLKVEDCLSTAYGEIKGRTGEMKDGIFVKSEDLK